jgi:Tfp pilus assembly protein PilF
VVLAAAVLAVYLPAATFDFVDYDDNIYVWNNPVVGSGLSLQGLAWAFTSTTGSNWHPLAWLSHQLDVELFGLSAGAHHLTSVLLHAAGTAGLFLLFRSLLGTTWAPFAAALIFGLHPLRVESAAWVAERKDVLAFLLLAVSLGSWLAYLRRPGRRRMALFLAASAGALMAKPSAVVLPLLLVLLDWWPLGRLGRGGVEARRLALEKLPVVGMAAAAGWVTWAVQERGESISSLQGFPLATRLLWMPVHYAWYLVKLVAPTGLAVFYPQPGTPPGASAVAFSAAVLLLLSAGALAARRRLPSLAMGWLWFLAALLPVIGLVKVGGQGVADRYSLIPHAGLLMGLAAAARFPAGWSRGAWRWTGVAGLASAVALAVMTRHQLGFWRDNRSLFERALAVTRDNYIAHNNLGGQAIRRGDPDAASRHYAEAVAAKKRLGLTPVAGSGGDADSIAREAAGLFARGRYREAAEGFSRSVRMAPMRGDLHSALAVSLALAGYPGEAEAHFRMAVSMLPGDAGVRVNQGLFLEREGRPGEAEISFREALRLDPGNREAAEWLASRRTADSH